MQFLKQEKLKFPIIILKELFSLPNLVLNLLSFQFMMLTGIQMPMQLFQDKIQITL